MGGKGKGKKKASAAGDADDALLDAAIAQASEERAAKEAEDKAKASAAREAQILASQVGMQEQLAPQLKVKDVVELLDTIPTFAIMNDSDGGQKKFMPMKFAIEGDSSPASTPEVCAFFIDPAEAKRTLAHAQAACPDLRLVLGAMPLGHAFALTVGWAEAKGTAPFVIRGSPGLTMDCRAHLVPQLEKAGLPSYWQIPVIMCEELQSAAVLPVFLTHGGLASTWKAAGHEGPPPKRLHILDLRMLVDQMLQPPGAERVNWSTVRFLGCERGSAVAESLVGELHAAGGFGSGKGSGDAAALAAEADAAAAARAAAARRADPEHDPPLATAAAEPLAVG